MIGGRFDPALLLLAVAALCMRLPGLSRSLWYDELVTLSSFTRTPYEAWTRQLAANNHPLASLLAWFAGLFGPDEVRLRFPFALAGALAAWALAWSAGVAGRRAALLAGALLACSPGAVLLSQQVRGYALLLLASALLPGLLARALAREGPLPRGLVTATALAAGLGAAAHLSLALPLALWTVLVVLAPRVGLSGFDGARSALLGLLGGWALAALAWAPTIGKTLRWSLRTLDEGDPGAAGRGLTPHDLLLLLGGADRPGPLLAVLLLGLAAAGLLLLARSTRPAERRLAAVLAAPLVAGALLLLVRAPGYPRFLSVCLPALLLAAGVGIARLAPRARAIGVLALLLALAVPPLGAQAGRELQDCRGAALLARSLAGAGPVLGGGMAGPLLEVYDPALRGEPAPDTPEAAALERILDDRDQPLTWVDPFPGFTAPERRARLVQALGEPLILPGVVTPVLVYSRR